MCDGLLRFMQTEVNHVGNGFLLGCDYHRRCGCAGRRRLSKTGVKQGCRAWSQITPSSPDRTESDPARVARRSTLRQESK